MRINRNSILIILLIVLLCIILTLIGIYTTESLSSIITIVTAVLGILAIWYQLKKEHDISRAEFIITLNTTFSENENISIIYKKLKLDRDTLGIEFTAEDGRLMGEYVMYFETMSYLINERIVDIKMVDDLFSGRFFVFVNHLHAQQYQLRYSGVMISIFELYCNWYNYRKKKGKQELFPKHQLHHELESYFIVNKKGFLSIDKKHLSQFVPVKANTVNTSE